MGGSVGGTLQRPQPKALYWVWLIWSSFFHCSPHSVVLCSGSWKGVDNTPMFWLLLSSAVHLNSPQLFQGSESGKDPGRRRSQASWPKGHSMLCDISSDIKAKGGRRNWGYLLFYSVCLPNRPPWWELEINVSLCLCTRKLLFPLLFLLY